MELHSYVYFYRHSRGYKCTTTCYTWSHQLVGNYLPIIALLLRNGEMHGFSYISKLILVFVPCFVQAIADLLRKTEMYAILDLSWIVNKLIFTIIALVGFHYLNMAHISVHTHTFTPCYANEKLINSYRNIILNKLKYLLGSSETSYWNLIFFKTEILDIYRKGLVYFSPKERKKELAVLLCNQLKKFLYNLSFFTTVAMLSIYSLISPPHFDLSLVVTDYDCEKSSQLSI